jgi:hypothetical protein
MFDASCIDASGLPVHCPDINYIQACSVASSKGMFDLSSNGLFDLSSNGLFDLSSNGLFDLSSVRMFDLSSSGLLDISFNSVMNTAYLLDNYNSLITSLQRNDKDNNSYNSVANYVMQPFSTVLVATFLAIIYAIVGIFYYEILRIDLLKLYKNNANWNTTQRNLTLHRFGLFCVMFLVMLAVIYGFVYVLILKGVNTKKALSVISLCILAILGSTFLFINNTTFVKVFENTAGYALVNWFWGDAIDNKLKGLFSHKFFKPEYIEYLNETKIPETTFSFSFILSLLNLQNFKDMMSLLLAGDAGVSKNPSVTEQQEHDIQRYLYDCTILKNTAGHFVWIYFAGIVTTLVSVKFLAKIK